MKKEKSSTKENHEIGEAVSHITVQLDDHTIVTVRRLSSFEKWRERFPKARII